MKIKDYLYTNTEMENIINEYIHSSRDRIVLYKCYIDGLTQERIAEEVELSPRQVSNIISKGSLVIAKCLESRE